MTRNTRHKMASGGIRDHIGGGFHRYAVDRAWRVPHFEKMLYDQAQLAVTYCEAWQITGDPLFLDVARGTLEYVLRELTHPEGGFFPPRTPRALPHTVAPDKPKARSICGPPLRLAMCLAPRRREYRYLLRCAIRGKCARCRRPARRISRRNILAQRQPVAESARQLGPSEDEPGSRWPLAEKGFSPFATSPHPAGDEKVLAAANGLNDFRFCPDRRSS